MCGITGFTTDTWAASDRLSTAAVQRVAVMTRALQHRGPDAQRAVVFDGAALGHTRLSIVDLAHGHQPMRDPRTGACLVFNGEIFNHLELREQLDAYPFRTHCDTEVILAAYDRWGMACVERFVGQWAFALWDNARRELHLSRDRVGVRPLYYAQTDEGVAFASEIKGILAGGFVKPRLDPYAIKEVACLWTPVSPRTSFEGIASLPPGCNAVVREGRIRMSRYWTLDLGDNQVDDSLTGERARAAVSSLLEDATRLRLRADVPVAAYLSGGLDSSLLCAMAQRQLRASGARLSTFSVAFSQARYNESTYQREVATALGTEHRELLIDNAQIGELIPEVVRLAEQVLVRSAPAPLLALSRLVREHDTKVVLTGEGADEFFWGYQLFQETKVRQFWARQPLSKWRYTLLHRLYPYLSLGQQNPALLKGFYGLGIDDPNQPGFSHLLRWSSTKRIWRFFSADFSARVCNHSPEQALLETVPPDFRDWRPLARAQYLEMHTLLSGYLLSAQGDRMLMGNSVEGRFPFLDHRVIELAARLPDSTKLRVLNEKAICKEVAAPLLPRAVLDRPKQPYRAPISEAFSGPAAPKWVDEVLNDDAIKSVGVFDTDKTRALRAKLARQGGHPSESDNMTLMAMVSVQLLDRDFVRAAVPSPAAPQVPVVSAEACNAGQP